jgi:hypothetical protein
MICDLKAIVRSSHCAHCERDVVRECACCQRKHVSLQALHIRKRDRLFVMLSYLKRSIDKFGMVLIGKRSRGNLGGLIKISKEP